MEPIVKVLRMVDGDKSPTMPWLYEAMGQMKEAVATISPHSKDQYIKIIEKRWEKMLLHPLHKAAYYFNPKYQYKNKLGLKSEFMSAVKDVVNRLVTSNSKRNAIMDQLKFYREGSGYFGHPNAVNAREQSDPIEWWVWHATEYEELRSLAIRVLSQTAAAGGCERNWSTFNLIHSKRRNRLGMERLNNLVYVHYNMRLRSRFIREYNFREVDLSMVHDPIDTAYTYGNFEDDNDDPLQAWMNDIGAAALDEEGAQPDAAVAAVSYDTSSSDDDNDDAGILQVTAPERIEEEPAHEAAAMEIDKDVEKAMQSDSAKKSTSKSKSKGKSAQQVSSSSSSSSSESNDDDSGGHGGDSAGQYQNPYADYDDRDYVYEGGRERCKYVPPEPAEKDRNPKVYQKRATRGKKEYAGAYPPPQAPQYQYGGQYSDDLAESMGSMSIADSASQLGDQLFGYPQSHHSGSHHSYHSGSHHSGSHHSGSHHSGSRHSSHHSGSHHSGSHHSDSHFSAGRHSFHFANPPPVAPSEPEPDYQYGSVSYFGGGFDPQIGPYSYSSQYHTNDGGQSWYGGAGPTPVAVIPVQTTVPVAVLSDNELEAMYPKIGMMQYVNSEVYKEHIATYTQSYISSISWSEYVNQINNIMYSGRRSYS